MEENRLVRITIHGALKWSQEKYSWTLAGQSWDNIPDRIFGAQGGLFRKADTPPNQTVLTLEVIEAVPSESDAEEE